MTWRKSLFSSCENPKRKKKTVSEVTSVCLNTAEVFVSGEMEDT